MFQDSLILLWHSFGQAFKEDVWCSQITAKDLMPDAGAEFVCKVHALGKQGCPPDGTGADVVFPCDALTGFLGGLLVFILVCTPSRGQRNKSTKNISSRLQIKVMLFHRCQNAKVTLETFRVVVMDITANHFHQFSTIRETLSIITLSLQDAPKSFHRAIVNAAANTRHTLCHASIDQPLVEVSVGILKSTVTVEDRMRIRISLDCLCKSVEHKFVVVCIPNHKGNNTSVI